MYVHLAGRLSSAIPWPACENLCCVEQVMLDESLKPWLIEANSSPALSATSRSDFELKCQVCMISIVSGKRCVAEWCTVPVFLVQLLIDTLDVLDLDGRRSGAETQVGGYDLVWEDGPVTAEAALGRVNSPRRGREDAAESSRSGSMGAAYAPQGSPLGSYMAPPGPAAVAAAAAATATKGRH